MRKGLSYEQILVARESQHRIARPNPRGCLRARTRWSRCDLCAALDPTRLEMADRAASDSRNLDGVNCHACHVVIGKIGKLA